METGILNFSQVVKGTARSSKGICFLLFLVFPYNIIFLYFQIRPQRWSIFQSDGMVNGFFQATIDFNGVFMVLTSLDHHHWMFFEGQPLESMVFRCFLKF